MVNGPIDVLNFFLPYGEGGAKGHIFVFFSYLVVPVTGCGRLLKEKSVKQMDLIEQFKESASLVSAVMHEVGTRHEALEMSVALCNAIIDSGGQGAPGDSGFVSDDSGRKPVTLAAPDLTSEDFKHLEVICRNRGIDLVTDTLRNYGDGIHTGLTWADYGIADTGTLVISSDSEEKRLATMISETHVALLPMSRIRTTALDMVEELEAFISGASSYTAFITGPSRTADIERVLAIGVHGPLALHIILLNDIRTDEEDGGGA